MTAPTGQPPIEAQRLLSGFRGYQLLVTACRLQIPDRAAAGPIAVDDLAASAGLHAGSLRRLLRGLVAWNLLVERPDGRYASTPLSDWFRADRPGLRNMTVMLGDEGYQAWSELMYSLQTGKPAFDHVFGISRFDKLAGDPEGSAEFNAAMVETSTRVASAFLGAYDFQGVRTVIDVGGGNGGLLMAVLQAHPQLRGVLFDLAQGLTGAGERLAAAGAADRVRLDEGSFFDSVPSDGDLYLLKSIVHDWDDEHAVAILRTCARAMGPDARLVLLERWLPDRIDDPDAVLSTVMSDLHMMVVLGGAERTAGEYGALLARAGLRLTRDIPTKSEFSIFEAVVDRP